MLEPTPTAWLFAVIGILIGISVLLSRASGRLGLPLALVFMVVGMLAGSEGIGGVHFDDYAFAFRMGTAALVLILFDGGLNTPIGQIREALAPAAVLATFGVIGTAVVLAVGVHTLLGLEWPEALLLGAVVSSTDAAAVFAILRGSGLHLRRPLGSVLELESGVNDPMAVILTISLTTVMSSGDDAPVLGLLLDVGVQLVVGLVLGAGIGHLTRLLLCRVRVSAGGLYPVLTIALALVAFGVPTLFLGSGFLAVYVAAVIIGNGDIPYRSGVLRVHDAMAWLSQVGMFLMLGLLAFPSELAEVAGEGFAVAAMLTLVARPVVVWLLTLPFRRPLREVAYLGWVGLRGAVPIILATFPVMYDVPGAHRIFNLVFFVVVLSALVPGATVPWVTRRLGLVAPVPPTPPAALEIHSTTPLNGRIEWFHIAEGHPLIGRDLASLPFPPSSSVLLVVRGASLVVAKGRTVIQAGDHMHVFGPDEDLPALTALLGPQTPPPPVTPEPATEPGSDPEH